VRKLLLHCTNVGRILNSLHFCNEKTFLIKNFFLTCIDDSNTITFAMYLIVLLVK